MDADIYGIEVIFRIDKNHKGLENFGGSKMHKPDRANAAEVGIRRFHIHPAR